MIRTLRHAAMYLLSLFTTPYTSETFHRAAHRRAMAAMIERRTGWRVGAEMVPAHLSHKCGGVGCACKEWKR